MKKKKKNKGSILHSGKLSPVHHINVTARRLCLLNKLHVLHPITRSLLPFFPFNTKAPYLHTVSEFYHRELNSLNENAKLLYIRPFLALLIVHCAEGKTVIQIR